MDACQHVTEAALQALLVTADADGDGKLGLWDFVAACINPEKIASLAVALEPPQSWEHFQQQAGNVP